jgi:HlyD family secretion protein
MADKTRRRPPIPVVIVLVLLLAGGGYWAWTWWQGRQAPASTALTAQGSVESKQYQVAAAMAGRVTAVAVAEGDTVTEGQTLVQLDTAALTLQVAQASEGVNAANAALTKAKKDGNSSDIAAAEARVNQAQAGVDLANVQLGYATVAAPHGGRVVSVTTNVGQNASPGKTLLTVQDASDSYVRVYVPETRIGAVVVGQKASVTTDSSTSTFDGKVSFVSSTSEFTPNNIQTKDQRVKLVYEVRVKVGDTAGVLKDGMPVEVTFAS